MKLGLILILGILLFVIVLVSCNKYILKYTVKTNCYGIDKYLDKIYYINLTRRKDRRRTSRRIQGGESFRPNPSAFGG